MSHHLRSCVKCARHIRITEATCPCCKTAVPEARMTPPPRGNTAGRLGRAFAVSTFAAAAGSLGATAACGSVEQPDIVSGADAYGVAQPDGGLEADVVTFGQAYGVAEPPDGDFLIEAGPDVITAADAYGVAPPPEAGVPDVITGADAYGVAPPEAGADVITGGQAYGVAEPPDGGEPGHP